MSSLRLWLFAPIYRVPPLVRSSHRYWIRSDPSLTDLCKKRRLVWSRLSTAGLDYS